MTVGNLLSQHVLVWSLVSTLVGEQEEVRGEMEAGHLKRTACQGRRQAVARQGVVTEMSGTTGAVWAQVVEGACVYAGSEAQGAGRLQTLSNNKRFGCVCPPGVSVLEVWFSAQQC